jgi:hypothetical protein
MLCTSAASRFMTMRRLKTNSLNLRATTAALILGLNVGLSVPAFATTTHKAHHPATAAKPTATAPAKTAPVAKAVPAKTPAKTVAHATTHRHTQTVAAKSAPAHTRPASIKNPTITQDVADTAPVNPVDKPTPADFAAAARVHAWVASQHGVAASPNTPVVAPATLRGPKAAKPAPPPLTPAVAKMLPGADDETTPALADAEASVSPMIAPAMVPLVYNKRGHLIMPAALKGSHDILVHQNEMADSEGLDRIQDDDDLARKIANKQLVPIPASAMLHVDERLPVNRRYCRPWVAQFLTDIALAHYARFHTPLQVNSAVRTVEFQDKLRRTNGNAAPSDGDTASPHLTGFAVDIAKRPLSQPELAWMRGYLLPLEQQGKIDVEEEFQQSCFHMSVYRKYLPTAPGAPRSQPAGSATQMLATGLR